MSSTSGSPRQLKSKKKGATKPPAKRSPSASEIARNFKNFEIWSSHNRCEQASFEDLPEDFKDDVHEIFDFSSKPRLPSSWLDHNSPEFKSLATLASKGLIKFLEEIHDQNPKLFGEIEDSKVPGLLEKIGIVHSAWRRLDMMKQSKEKYSEADYAANVYNVFRSPAIQESTLRVQCNISLPQPVVTTALDPETVRILGTKAAAPDCAMMIPSAAISSLSLSKNSPFQVLKRHPNVVKSGNVSKCSSFRFQSTPLVAPPEMPAFQFCSSFSEDKKPVHQMLEDAYRPNRMSTTAAARHLHTHHVVAPIFGLVWASGTVRAHVDWWAVPEGPGKNKHPTIYSAPYLVEDRGEGADTFHEWQLDKAADIVEVFFLIENIDHWTVNGFCERVIKGVKDLQESVVKRKEPYIAWKRVGDLSPSSATAKENNVAISASTTSSAQSTPPQKSRNRHRR
ncbi:hypothetical protein MSAN_02174500 [Mycena sanguinolenta]|uniref:Uncharacterized protein n=1 Tax=Mycena sanguinolenta TaxID=230812 RepID=A0A8H6XDY9_9AGAR|nr:hypothetical protein MSAN_02174500 [Mycena sanguinolenta]